LLYPNDSTIVNRASDALQNDSCEPIEVLPAISARGNESPVGQPTLAWESQAFASKSGFSTDTEHENKYIMLNILDGSGSGCAQNNQFRIK
jgi:hypothetical protein